MPSKKKLRKTIKNLKWLIQEYEKKYHAVWEERRQLAERLSKYEPMGMLPHIRLSPTKDSDVWWQETHEPEWGHYYKFWSLEVDQLIEDPE